MRADPDADLPYGYTPPTRDDFDENQRGPNSRAKVRIGVSIDLLNFN